MIHGTDLWSFDQVPVQELGQIKIRTSPHFPPHEWGSPSSVVSWDGAAMAQFCAVLGQDLEQSQPRKNMEIWGTRMWI